MGTLKVKVRPHIMPYSGSVCIEILVRALGAPCVIPWLISGLTTCSWLLGYYYYHYSLWYQQRVRDSWVPHSTLQARKFTLTQDFRYYMKGSTGKGFQGINTYHSTLRARNFTLAQDFRYYTKGSTGKGFQGINTYYSTLQARNFTLVQYSQHTKGIG